MTEQEYMTRVQAVRRQISGGQLELAGQRLTELYAYKPIRLLWFVARAEYILRKEKDPERALKSLDGKYFLGEDYPGLKECMKFRSGVYKSLGKKDDSIRENYLYQKACKRSCAMLESGVAEALEALASDAGSGEALTVLAGALYRTSDMAAYFIVHKELARRGLVDERGGWVREITNYGYLEEAIDAETSTAFILVMDEYLDRTLEILGHLLSQLGRRVFVLTPPLAVETEGRVDLKATVPVSMEQAEQYPDMCVIPPVVLTEAGEAYGDNRDYIIDHLCRERCPRDHAVILCSGHLLEDLYTREGLRGRIGRLSPYETDFCEEKVQFGWAGSYLSYISDIYQYDVRQDIDRKPEVDFSIVVPARNSAATLRYTLQTCLRQRFQGSYEILVSDNSVDGSTEVYELCRELDDPRIRYVKAPRSLPLAKSFEFAYLQTRGRFVLSIGSDDGVLPWGLEVLAAVLDQCPAEEIVLWERGFYAWPGFNGGQENMFLIPRRYVKGQLDARYVPTEYMLDLLGRSQQMVYAMPMLYINSGFRRRYLKTLLEKTGKLWDGPSQDLPMAVINSCLYERILKINYPVIIAGMSSASVGGLSTRPDVGGAAWKKESKLRKIILQQDNVGIFVPAKRERLLAPAGIDAYGIYVALSKAVGEGLLSADRADGILSWKTAALRILETFSSLDETYDLLIHTNCFIWRNLGEHTLCAAIREAAFKPRLLDAAAVERQMAEKSYAEEVDADGAEALDASRYGVHNILQAVELFEKRTGL